MLASIDSRSPLRLMALLPVVALAGCAPGEARNAAPAQAAPDVTAAEVLVRELHDWSDFTGRVEPVEQVDVRPRVSGYIESVHFEEGGRVNDGDLLFRIDARPFEAEVARLRAERDRAQAQLKLARSNAARAARLFAENAASREELESLEADETVAEAALGATEAAIDATELDLAFTRVTAPISGRVSRANVTPGNLVDGTSVLTTIVSQDPVHVYFDADEHTYLEHVRQSDLDSAAPVYIGLVNEQGYPHEGRLDFVDNSVDARQGTIRARAVLDNPDGAFTPGLFARVRVLSPDARGAALVEERAIGTDLGRRFVLVLDEHNVAQYRTVETGRRVDELRIVTDGLERGDVVIVNGLQRVRAGMPVAPRRVAMGGDASSLDRFVATGSHADGRAALLRAR